MAGSDGIKDSGAKLYDFLLERFAAILNCLQPVVKQPHDRNLRDAAFDRPIQIVVRSSRRKNVRRQFPAGHFSELDLWERLSLGFNSIATAITPKSPSGDFRPDCRVF